MLGRSSIKSFFLAALCAWAGASARAESFRFDRLNGLAGPFEGLDAAGRLFLVEKLGDVGAIPLYAYRTSDETPPHGLLGPGWHIPLLECRIVPTDEKTYEFLQPDGLRREIRVSRDNPELLTSPRVWKGQAKGDKVSLQADVAGGARYTLAFRQGRLVHMQVEEGSFDFAYAGRFVERVSSKGQTLLAVVRDARDSTRVDFRFADGARVRVARTADAVNIYGADGRVRTFARGTDGGAPSLTAGAWVARWDRTTLKLAAQGDWTYTFGEAKPDWNNAPIERLNRDGRREFYWFNLANGKGEYRLSDGTQYRWARFPSGDLYGLMRWSEKTRRGQLLHRSDYSYDSARRLVYSRFARGDAERAGGALCALEERWYAADGSVRHTRLDGGRETP